jgi:hypothetical protein
MMRVILWMLMLLSGPAMAQMSVATDPDALSKKICSNLAATSQQVLDDHSDTRKYLSPYIAIELYEQVVARSMAALGVADTDPTMAPEMSSLPCQDTVSDFMMAIKKRMEYGRFDRMLVAYRVWFVGGGIMLLGGLLIYGLLHRRSSGQGR